MNTRRILVIAGSDSSGGAGLEADQKVIAAHGCYAMTATTALTSQNTTGVFGIHATPPSFIRQQIDVCVQDVGVDVVKTGMLASAQTISTVVEALRAHNIKTVVVDPVMVSTSGSQLLPEEAISVLIENLLPLTTILTPNLPEAQLISRTVAKAADEVSEPQSVGDLIAMARRIAALGPQYVLLKGGHLPLTKDRRISAKEADHQVVVDVLVGQADGETYVFESEYIRSKNTHGTGCSLASAIACNLANGKNMHDAVRDASRYVEAGIRTSRDLGKGSGPINHFHSTYTLPFAPGHFIDYLLEHQDVQIPWKEHTEHTFVQQMADGSLPIEKFQNYLIQDYLFLIQFARANALAAYKASSVADISNSAKIVSHIFTEMQLHIEYCKEYNVSEEEIMKHGEHQGTSLLTVIIHLEACTAYTRYVLDIGQSQDWFALQVALLPCLVGYGAIARKLYDDSATKREGNRYWKWIETYVADDYVEAMRLGRDLAEKHAIRQSSYRIDELVKIFIHATKMETGFWDMGSL